MTPRFFFFCRCTLNTKNLVHDFSSKLTSWSVAGSKTVSSRSNLFKASNIKAHYLFMETRQISITLDKMKWQDKRHSIFHYETSKRKLVFWLLDKHFTLMQDEKILIARWVIPLKSHISRCTCALKENETRGYNTFRN